MIEVHRTTLVFVNTRRMAERVARQLSERLGEAAVTAHHGSLSKDSNSHFVGSVDFYGCHKDEQSVLAWARRSG
jgi:ATP-dependent helicase YprA (DUF1998 family)